MNAIFPDQQNKQKRNGQKKPLEPEAVNEIGHPRIFLNSQMYFIKDNPVVGSDKSRQQTGLAL